MKRLTLILWLTTLMTVSIASASIISQAYEITATAKGISLPQGSEIVYREECDINSDGTDETVYVYGENNQTEKVFVNINVALVTSDGLLKRTNQGNLNGTDVNVNISDYNSDGIKDVLVTARESHKLNCLLADFSHSIPKNIMTDKALEGLSMKLSFVDDFKVWAELENGQNFSINVAASAPMLCENKVYTSEGEYMSGMPELRPVTEIASLEHDFGSNLLFTQQLYIGNTNKQLCSIQSEMEYTGDTLLVKRIEYFVE